MNLLTFTLLLSLTVEIYSLVIVCVGNKDKAQKALNLHHSELRQKDTVLISFFAGVIAIMVVFIIFIFIIPGSEIGWEDYFDNTLPTFGFTFMIIFVLASIAVDIHIFKKYKVNYLFIFELDPHYKMTHIQFYRVN